MANNSMVTMSGSGPSSYIGNGRVVIALMRVLSLAVPAGMVDVIWTPLDIAVNDRPSLFIIKGAKLS